MISQKRKINFHFRMQNKDILVSRVHVEQTKYRNTCDEKHNCSQSQNTQNNVKRSERLQRRKMLTSILYKKRQLEMTILKQNPNNHPEVQVHDTRERI